MIEETGPIRSILENICLFDAACHDVANTTRQCYAFLSCHDGSLVIEISLLHKLLDTYHDLFEQVKTREPTKIELIGIAGILHSFYSGFENIFKLIAQEIDNNLKKTDSWHVDLLETMIVSTPKHSSVITEDLKERLQSYLSFRHVFRSLYSYNLNWSKMQSLVFESEEILQLVEADLNKWVKTSLSTI